MENRVYICSWSHDGERYRVWVRNRPTVCAEHASFVEADIELAGAICLAFGDGEGVTEYDRPRPGTSDRPGLVTVVVSVLGNGWGTEQNLDELHEGDRCIRCLTPRGARTATPLRVSGIRGGADGGRTSFGFVYFSEGFLELLTPEERDGCEWRRIERTGRTTKVYYELLGAQVRVRPVVLLPVVERLWNVSLADAAADWMAVQWCELCGHEIPYDYTFWPQRGLPHRFVDRAAVPEPMPASFIVGKQFSLSRARWQSILGRPGTRGISSGEVGVVESSLVDPSPKRVPIPPHAKREAK
ncbi:MAG: hypothetical protein HYV19_06625 [Gemmatimonadetes bacterium]|nr:hypothetical protein [Gemmatimonadota bacterium]